MSIDLNWDTVTTGPDGQVLARKIRDFIHGKFQEISLPRFIKSVTVHDFDFGTVPPELEIKDITDPLPDFYEENSDLDDAGDEADDADDGGSSSTRAGPGPDLAGRDSDPFDDLHVPDGLRAAAERRLHAVPPHLSLPGGSGFKSATPLPQQDLGSPFLGVSTPGIPGGTSNLHYFHSQFATGLSGTQTPLAALASAQHMSGGRLESTASARDLRERLRADHGGGGGISSAGQSRGRSRNLSQSSVGDYIPAVDGGSSGLAAIHGSSSFASGLGLGIPIAGGSSYLIHPTLREKHGVSTLAPTSVGASRPPTRAGVVIAEADGGGGDFGHDAHQYMEKEAEPEAQQQRRFREPRIEDIQAVFRIKYAGNIKLLLTADILLDYPMPSFVGIPVQLSITGVTFDGVGVVAYIRKRVHFCFLSPEDALAAVGGEGTGSGAGSDSQGAAAAAAEGKPPNPPGRLGGLLQEIRVESEIGQREGGKQSLKNVGKVERFVLEQVRRILEEEFVYPSFWTVLV